MEDASPMKKSGKRSCANQVFRHTVCNMNAMKKQTKTTERKIRMEGEPGQYYTLKLKIDGEVVNVHTSKDLSYIIGLESAFLGRNH
jgi:hypothetical protein